MGKRLGLLIGINQYQDSTFQPLQFAETDARALAQWLVNARGGGWNPSDVQVSLGSQATGEQIQTLIKQCCLSMAGPDDLVFIYFAGHAFVDQANGDGYLALSNTSHRQPASGLHLLSLARDVLARSGAAQVLFVLDCFQTGAAWNARRASAGDFKPLFSPALLGGLQQLQGRLFYCTCRGNESTPEAGEKGLGTFAYRTIVGLCGPAVDPATGQVTLQRLHTFLSESLPEQHRPQVFGREERSLVLVGELPSFNGTGQNGHGTGPFASAPPSQSPTGPSTDQALTPIAARGATATQMTPSTSGQVSLAVLEQSRQQQCMQMLNQARQLVQAQNLPQAYSLTENILQMMPTFVDALILKGQILGTTGKFQEALSTARQVVQLAPDNALGWSMAAALLANTGQLHDALSAADRSLELDPGNVETRTIRETIQVKLTLQNGPAQSGTQISTLEKQGGPKSFLLGAAIHILALIMGITGAALLVFQPHLPIIVAFGLESFGLGAICVNAARGAYRYGATRLLFTFLMSLLTGGVLGALYLVKPLYNALVNRIVALPPLIVPVLFLAIWLAAAAVLPLLLAIGGLITGIIVRARRK